MPLFQEGKLRPLAATSPRRFAELPDVPTMIESGFPDFTVPAMFGVVAPAATPRAIIDKLNATINRELASPEMQKMLANMGAERGSGSPQDFAAIFRRRARQVGSGRRRCQHQDQLIGAPGNAPASLAGICPRTFLRFPLK